LAAAMIFSIADCGEKDAGNRATSVYEEAFAAFTEAIAKEPVSDSVNANNQMNDLDAAPKRHRKGAKR
jgi:hypothetical protein